MEIKAWIVQLLDSLTNLVPPGEGQNHAIQLLDGKVTVNLMSAVGWQLYYLEDRDFALGTEALAHEIYKLHVAAVERNGIAVDPTNVTVNGQ